MPLLFWVALLIPLVIALPLGYVIARRTLGPTAGTRRFLAVLPILLGFTVLGALLARVLIRNGGTNGFVVFQFGFVLLMVGLIGYMQYRTRQAGALLLDLSRPRQQRFLRIISLIMLAFAGMLAVLAIVDGGITLEDTARILFQVSMGGLYLFLSTRHTQLREHGLVANGDVLWWRKISGYQWEADRPYTLTLQVNTNMSFVSRPSIPIPPQHRDAVDRLLAQYVNRAAPA